MQILTTSSRLAVAAGISRQAVEKSRGLKAAAVGRRFDLAHPAAVKWMEERGVRAEDVEALASGSRAKRAAKGEEPSEPTTFEVDSLASVPLDQVMDLTLRELTERHGTVTHFVDWLRSRKTLAEANRIEVLLAEDQGRLIERDFVAAHVFGLLEQMSERLLHDAARTLARTVSAKAKAGEPLEAIQQEISIQLGKAMTETKERAVRALRQKARKDPLQ